MKLVLRILFIIMVVLSLVIFYKSGLSAKFTYENIENFKNILLQKYGLLLPIVIILLYIFFNIVGLPTMYFSILMGYLYNIILGLIIALIGMISGIIASFLISKYLFKDYFFVKFRHNKYYNLLMKYTKDYEIKTILLTRLIFIIPYNIQNFLYGLTNVNFFNYLIYTFIGIIPITTINVLIGKMLKLDLKNSQNIGYLMIIAVTIAFIVLSIIIIKNIYKSKMENKYGKQQ